MSYKIAIDKDYLKSDIIDPLARLYGEIESTGKLTSVEELEVILVKLNKAFNEVN